MGKKALVLAVMVLAGGFVLQSCASFKAAQAPVKAHLEAWKKADFQDAYSYMASRLKENYSFQTFSRYARANPIKSFKMGDVSLAEGRGTIEGSVTLKDGEKLGFRYKVVELREDEWMIASFEAFSKRLL